MSEAAGLTADDRRGVVAAALPRHGPDRLRLHAAAHRHAALALATRSPQPAPVAGADHQGAGDLHGVAGLRLPQLRAQRAGHRRVWTSRASSRRSRAPSRCGPRPSRPSSGTSGSSSVISPCYGLAEATLAVAIWPRGMPLRLDASGRFLSVGQPCRGVAVRIVEPREARRRRRARGHRGARGGAEGEMCVKSPGVMQGYYSNPEATRQRALARWLAPHRRPRLRRRRGLPLRHRPRSRT